MWARVYVARRVRKLWIMRGLNAWDVCLLQSVDHTQTGDVWIWRSTCKHASTRQQCSVPACDWLRSVG